MWFKNKKQRSSAMIPPGLAGTRIFSGRDGLGFPFATIWNPNSQTATVMLRAVDTSLSLHKTATWERQLCAIDNVLAVQTVLSADEIRFAVSLHAETRPERKDPTEFVARIAGMMPKVHELTDQVAQTTPLIEGEVNAIVEQALGGTIAQWPQVETKVVETATQLELAKYHYAVFETGAQITERTDALEEIIRHPQVGPHVSLARTFRPNEEGEDGRAGGLLCLRAPQAQHVEAIADVVFDALSAQERLRIHRMLGRQWAGFMESLGIGSYGWDHLTVAGV